MSFTVFFAVLLAALLHASWNALLKSGEDKLLGMAGVILGHAPLAMIALFFVPLPLPQSWPYILLGTGFHLGYQYFLLNSYKIGDLTQIYPIARGSAPLIVTLFSIFVLGVALSGQQLLAVLAITIGLASLGIVRKGDGLHNPKAALLALTTGMFIASYSITDGIGARLAGNSIAYYSSLALLNAVISSLYLLIRSPQTLRILPTKGLKTFIIGGSSSYIAYTIVTWAFTQAPIALVTALRETSIIFALLMGVFFLKERLDLAKMISTAITLAGVVLLRFAKS